MTIIKFALTLMFQGVIPMYFGFGANPMMGSMKQQANTAGQVAGGYGSTAAGESGALNPFYAQEMKAKHAYDPNQVNELLTQAEAGAGGATGGATGLLMNNAARTGNATGVTKSLDEMARDKAKAAAGASEGIAAQDVMGAKQLNQAGAAGMQGLYGTNVGAQLNAMKEQASDTQAAANMDKGWFTNFSNLVLQPAAQAASAFAPKA